MSGKKNLPGPVKIDPWLEPYAEAIADRKSIYEKELARICAQYGSLEAYATAHEELGIQTRWLSAGLRCIKSFVSSLLLSSGPAKLLNV